MSGSTRGMPGSVLEDREALYYPYVHIRDDEWLKKTLLIVPAVARMVGEGFQKTDGPLVAELSKEVNGRRPLVRLANLRDQPVIENQKKLATWIEDDLAADRKGFAARYGKKAALAARPEGDKYGYQLYLGKSVDQMATVLKSSELVWIPDAPLSKDYHEIHPVLGQAILGALAVSCAHQEGFDIVGQGNDRTTRELNQIAALDAPLDIYNRLVHGRAEAAEQDRKGNELLEMLVYVNCDTSKLTPDGLFELAKEREPIRELKIKLYELSLTVPTAANADRQAELLQDRLNDVWKAWEADKANWGRYLKEIFRDPAPGVQKVADKYQVFANALGFSGTGAFGASAAGLDPMIGATLGLTVAFVNHAVKSVQAVKDKERKSSFRLLTAAEKQGVVFSIAGSR